MPPTLKTEVFQALSQATEILSDLRNEVKGDVEKSLQRVEKTHSDAIAEFRKERKEDLERVRALELWQSRMMGIGVAVAFVMTVAGMICAGVIVEEIKAVSTQIWSVNRPVKP